MKKILVFASEAGGAEILSSLIRHNKNKYDWQIFLAKDSPASQIFKKKGLGKFVKNRERLRFDSLSKKNFDYFFYATSWTKNEFALVTRAQRLGIISVAFMDHWICFRERFGYPEKDWKRNFPDFVAIGDEYAYDLAKKFRFPNLVKINNYYLNDLTLDFKAEKKKFKSFPTNLLYLSQTITGDSLYGSPFQKMEKLTIGDILKNFSGLSKNFDFKNLTIRLHPSQQLSNFKKILKEVKAGDKINIKIEEARKTDLLKSLSQANLVIGMDSMALFIAHLLGCPAVSYLPKKIPVNLPLPKPLRFHSLPALIKAKKIIKDKHQPSLNYYTQYPLENLIKILEKNKYAAKNR